MMALGIRNTAFAETEKAVQIINIFGKGPLWAQEVVDVLGKDEVQGSGPLLEFLVQWKKDHPVTVV
jgi:hypothetical protein